MKLMEVTCRCGWITRGSEREVIQNIQAHGKAAHALDVRPAEIRKVWRLVEDDGASGRPGQKA